jgi:hypothetical protein
MRNNASKKRPKDRGSQNYVAGKNQALGTHFWHLVLNWSIYLQIKTKLQGAGRGAIF